jgi:hypothetical protein
MVTFEIGHQRRTSSRPSDLRTHVRQCGVACRRAEVPLTPWGGYRSAKDDQPGNRQQTVAMMEPPQIRYVRSGDADVSQ